MKEWNVRIDGQNVGTVWESTEQFARCAALSKFGVTDDELHDALGDKRKFPPSAIFSDTEFHVIEKWRAQ